MCIMWHAVNGKCLLKTAAVALIQQIYFKCNNYFLFLKEV